MNSEANGRHFAALRSASPVLGAEHVRSPHSPQKPSTGRQPSPRARSARIHWSPPDGTQLTGTLAVRTLGAAGPPVVLLHGLASSGLFWGADYDALAEGARLVVPDLLGFGRSPRPRSGYGPNEHADAVASTLHQLGAEDQPAIVVGHSVGALVALRLAARYPSLVAAIVGFGPPIYRDYAAARHCLAGLGPMARLFGLDTRWAELACKSLCQRRRRTAAALAMRLRPELPKAIAADAVEHSWESFSETLTRLVLTAEAPEWLDEIDCPIHLIVGDQDRVVDIPFLHELTRRHPAASLHVWTGARHDLPLIQPAKCRAAIAHRLANARPARSVMTRQPRRAS